MSDKCAGVTPNTFADPILGLKNFITKHSTATSFSTKNLLTTLQLIKVGFILSG